MPWQRRGGGRHRWRQAIVLIPLYEMKFELADFTYRNKVAQVQGKERHAVFYSDGRDGGIDRLYFKPFLLELAKDGGR